MSEKKASRSTPRVSATPATPRVSATRRVSATPATPRAAPQHAEEKRLRKMAGLQKETDHLQRDRMSFLPTSSKRMRPTMTYTAEDRAAMEKEANDPSDPDYRDSGVSDSEPDSD